MQSSHVQTQETTSFRGLMFLAAVLGVLLGLLINTPLQDMTMPSGETLSRLWVLLGRFTIFAELGVITHLLIGFIRYRKERRLLDDLQAAPHTHGFTEEDLIARSWEIFNDVIDRCEKVEIYAPCIGFSGTLISIVAWTGFLNSGGPGSISDMVVGVCSTIIGQGLFLFTVICQEIIENAQKRRQRDAYITA